MKLINKIATALLNKADYGSVVKAYHSGKQSSKGIEWNRQTTNMSAKEIKDWKLALMAATNPENPRRGELMRFYENLLTDLHLCACIDNRILPVQCAPFKLVDANDDEDYAAKKLLDKPWYIDLVKLVCNSTFEGTKLIEMFTLNAKMELKEINEVPQSNFVAPLGVVLKSEYDSKGVSYKEGAYADYYVQVGGDWNMGLLNRVAVIVIAKKLGLGSWMSYIEKYGVPPIFAITDRVDTNRRDELFEMLENFRMNHFAVLQGDERIETPQGYNVDAYNTFKSLIDDVANKEISKYILGGTGTTDEKAFVGAADVHHDLLKLRNQVDKLLFKFYFNEEIKPRLVKLSPVYAPLQNLTFEWDDAENLSVKEIIESISTLSAHYEFDIEELERLTGLPFTALKQMGLPSINTGGDKKDAAPKGNKAEPKATTTTDRTPIGFYQPQQKAKKKDIAPKVLIYPPAKAHLKEVIANTLIYAAATDKDAERVAKLLQDDKLKPSDLDKSLVQKSYNALNKSAENGWGTGYFENEKARAMRENMLKFSGAKVNRLLEDIEAGKRGGMSSKELTDHAKKVTNLQMDAWLTTERRGVARSAQMAKDWQKYEGDKDIYPNLKNRTMMDGAVRDDHAENEGIVKPVDEWTITPPYDYNCRCWLEQTTDEPTEGRPLKYVNESFMNNPGIDGEVFGPQHAYFDMRKSVEKLVYTHTQLLKEDMPYSRTIEVGKQTVHVSDFADYATLDADLEASKLIAPAINKNIYIRPVIDADTANTLPFGIGSKKGTGTLRTFSDKDKSVSGFINNAMNSANTQGASTAIIDMSLVDAKQTAEINKGLKKALNNRNDSIKEVIIIRGKKVEILKRSEIDKL